MQAVVYKVTIISLKQAVNACEVRLKAGTGVVSINFRMGTPRKNRKAEGEKKCVTAINLISKQR